MRRSRSAHRAAHVHNVRREWVRFSAPHLNLPDPLDRARCTCDQARALTASAASCSRMLEAALADPRQIEEFRREGWARPWHAGVPMLAYMITHEAHHRGQICMLAHQTRIPFAGGSGGWHVELGTAVEGVRIHASALAIPAGAPIRG